MITPRKPPYEGTESDPDKTSLDIEKLLRAYGVESVRWTKEYAKNRVSLEFLIDVEVKGIKKQVAIQVEPPPLASKRKTWDPKAGKYAIVWAPNWAQSMRLLLWWLKAKLEAVAYGLTTVEKEFLSQVMVNLPEGGSRTVGELIGEKVVEGTLLEEKTVPPPQFYASRRREPEEGDFKEVQTG